VPNRLIRLHISRLGLFLLAAFPAVGQHNQLLMDDSRYGISKLAIDTNFFYSASVHSSVDLKPYCPPVADQDDETCYAYAATYAGASVAFNAAHHCVNKDKVAFSPGFTVKLCTPRHRFKNRHCSKSGNIADAACVMANVGAVPLADYPYECSCNSIGHLRTGASSNKLRPHNLITREMADTLAIHKIKAALSHDQPVVISFLDMASFDACWHQSVWKMSKAEESNIDTCTIFHAACIVGYNDTTGTFTLMNSWGTKFGNGGFIDVSYHDLIALMSMAISLQAGSINNND